MRSFNYSYYRALHSFASVAFDLALACRFSVGVLAWSALLDLVESLDGLDVSPTLAAPVLYDLSCVLRDFSRHPYDERDGEVVDEQDVCVS